jgi:hypothetical protein
VINFLEGILDFYRYNNDLINLIKDALYFSTFILGLNFLWNWNFRKKTKEIEDNLKFRKQIEEELQEYVIEKSRNNIKDIGIRFVYWKNYPWKLDDDGFKHLLNVKYLNGELICSSWIDSVGIYFEEDLRYLSLSLYLDDNGIFFITSGGKQYPGFKEFKDKILIFQLPFTKIMNFDFREKIEYEPVFYIKYHYANRKKLYDHKYILRENPRDEYFSIELDSRKQLDRYSWIGHMYKKALSKFL